MDKHEIVTALAAIKSDITDEISSLDWQENVFLTSIGKDIDCLVGEIAESIEKERVDGI